MVSSYLINPDDVNGDVAVLEGDEAAHATKSARKRPGDAILLIDGVGKGYRSIVADLGPRRVVCRIIEELPGMGEPNTRATLAIGVTKGDRFEDAIEKCVELGVGAIIPLQTRYSVVQSPSENRRRRWEGIARSAAKQCLRCRVPEIRNPVRLGGLLANTREFSRILVAWEGNQQGRLPSLSPEASDHVLGVVGPEGGFHEEEIRLLTQAGASSVPLGPRRLRTGTAAMALLTLILNEAGEYARCLPPHID